MFKLPDLADSCRNCGRGRCENRSRIRLSLL